MRYARKLRDEKAHAENTGAMPNRWTTDDIDLAFRQTICAGYPDANFVALRKNLARHKYLLRLVEMILASTARNGVSFF